MAEEAVTWSNDENTKVNLAKAIPQTLQDLICIYWTWAGNGERSSPARQRWRPIGESGFHPLPQRVNLPDDSIELSPKQV
jgi:hypothetical protein